jgi:hypothetical protein
MTLHNLKKRAWLLGDKETDTTSPFLDHHRPSISFLRIFMPSSPPDDQETLSFLPNISQACLVKISPCNRSRPPPPPDYLSNPRPIASYPRPVASLYTGPKLPSRPLSNAFARCPPLCPCLALSEATLGRNIQPPWIFNQRNDARLPCCKHVV